ncbi:MAG: aminoacyl-tRNA hydrolase [Solirubrobacteraceae bacterium]|nr:aminoacyl-tRNA hydrolase [Solirubrobacteraceae bacterium]
MSADRLNLGRGISIAASEVELRTSRSSGPGGQHANTSDTRVEAVFDVEASRSLTAAQRRLITERCGPVVTTVAQDSRSQARNREKALERMREKLSDALKVAPRRRPTRPTRASRERRLAAKRRQAERKRDRRPPADG